ncbi:MAG: BolA family transcriptional regulator [Pseudomonadales bacterium]|nr:BolA family transcriptional regulator [Pseudomonadales bacterium]
MSVRNRIERRLEALHPLHLEVLNESGNHRVPEGSESHFKVTIVSREFESMSRVERHRAVNRLLSSELDGPVHALAIHPYTEAEWKRRFGRAPLSPPCSHGK